MAYETRLEAIYRVIYVPFHTRMEANYAVRENPYLARMEIRYFVVGAGDIVPLSGISVTETVGSGQLHTPVPRSLSGISILESVGGGHLHVAAPMQGTSVTIHTSEGRLTLRPHFGGVGVTLTDGVGRLTRLIEIAGRSDTATAGIGTLVIPVDVDGISVTVTDGAGDMIAPYPAPIEGPWITLTLGSGTLFVIANLRGPSLTRTTGRGVLRVDDQGSEVAEAMNLARRLPDTYAKHRGSRIFRLFRVVGAELAELRRALQTTERMRDIDQATGATLDGIGRNVRQPRGRLPDRAYRALIKAKIARHMSPGDVNSIKQVVSAMLDIPMTAVGVRQLWRADPPEPAAVEISAPMDALAKFELTPTQFAAIMQHVVAAGVRATSLLGGTFELSELFETGDEERGLADDAMTVGGTLGEYYDVGDDIDLPLEGI